MSQCIACHPAGQILYHMTVSCRGLINLRNSSILPSFWLSSVTNLSPLPTLLKSGQHSVTNESTEYTSLSPLEDFFFKYKLWTMLNQQVRSVCPGLNVTHCKWSVFLVIVSCCLLKVTVSQEFAMFIVVAVALITLKIISNSFREVVTSYTLKAGYFSA